MKRILLTILVVFKLSSCVYSQVDSFKVMSEEFVQLDSLAIDSLLVKFFDNNRPDWVSTDVTSHKDQFRADLFFSDIIIQGKKSTARYYARLFGGFFEEGIVQIDTIGVFVIKKPFLSMTNTSPYSNALASCPTLFFTTPSLGKFCETIIAIRVIPEIRYECEEKDLFFEEKWECTDRKSPKNINMNKRSYFFVHWYNTKWSSDQFSLWYMSLLYKDFQNLYYFPNIAELRSELRKMYPRKRD